jgi:hypothetical protein
MNAKNILVSFLVIASVLFLASTVSAVTPSLGDVNTVKINDITVFPGSTDVSINGGDTVNIEVQFTAIDVLNADPDEPNSTSDVKMKAELEGEDIDVIAVSNPFVVIGGKTYTKTLTIKVPTDLKDQLSDSLTLSLRIYNSDFEIEAEDITLTVQRPSYEISIKSVMTSNAVEAGQLFPVDIVLKNTGYNDLSDLYVTVKIAELGIEKSAYFGDLVPLKDCDDDDDCDNENTVSGRLYLEVPYNVKSGTYTLQVKAENEDAKSVVLKEIVINNAVSEIAMKSGTNSLTLLNPTNQIKVYTVNYEKTSVNVVIPAASSKDITINVPASGEYNFDVSVFSGNTLLSTVNFSGTGQAATQLTSPVMVLTVILAVVFLVLLVVLVVLITKKPQKTEEFGESYY